FVGGAVQSHAESTDLAHADAVAPSLTIKGHSDEVASRVSLFIEVGETVAQTKQTSETQSADDGAARRPLHFGGYWTFRRTTRCDSQSFQLADVQRFYGRIQFLFCFMHLPHCQSRETVGGCRDKVLSIDQHFDRTINGSEIKQLATNPHTFFH